MTTLVYRDRSGSQRVLRGHPAGHQLLPQLHRGQGRLVRAHVEETGQRGDHDSCGSGGYRQLHRGDGEDAVQGESELVGCH